MHGMTVFAEESHLGLRSAMYTTQAGLLPTIEFGILVANRVEEAAIPWEHGCQSATRLVTATTVVCDKVHERNKGLSCSSKQTNIAPKISMVCAPSTPLQIVILLCL
jgi:hypothetical protein